MRIYANVFLNYYLITFITPVPPMDLTTDITILIVDDEAESLSILKRLFRKELYATYFASGTEEALRIVEKLNINIIVTELVLSGHNSTISFIDTVKRLYPDIVRIILSGTEDTGLIVEAVNTGQIFRFIPKPIVPPHFKHVITDAIDYHRILVEHKEMSLQAGKKNNYLTSINDELREVTTRLRESETRFRSMNDAAFDPIFLLNDAGRIVYANPAAESIFGYSRQEFMSMSFCAILLDASHPGSATLSSCAPINVHSQGTSLEGIKKNGEKINIEISTGSVLLKSKPHTVLIARDNTLRISEENARLQLEKVQRTLESQIEKRLLQSTLPDTLKGASLGRFMLSSGHLNGDFMEVIMYDDRHADIMLGDVMGHGVLSALVGSGLKSLYLKTVAQKKHISTEPPLLEDIVTEMHAQCINDLIELEIFATLFFLRIDLQAMEFSMIDCGHTATLHYQAAKGTSSRLKGQNLPVGMIETQEFYPVKVAVAPDDLIVIYSDGITEARTQDGSLYGEERLFELVEKYHDTPADRIIKEIRHNLAMVTGSETYDDDMSCIVIRIDSQPDSLPLP